MLSKELNIYSLFRIVCLFLALHGLALVSFGATYTSLFSSKGKASTIVAKSLTKSESEENNDDESSESDDDFDIEKCFFTFHDALGSQSAITHSISMALNRHTLFYHSLLQTQQGYLRLIIKPPIN